jgi:hypothetical protein
MPIWLGFAILIIYPFLVAFLFFIVMEGLVRLLYKMLGEKPPPLWRSKDAKAFQSRYRS